MSVECISSSFSSALVGWRNLSGGGPSIQHTLRGIAAEVGFIGLTLLSAVQMIAYKALMALSSLFLAASDPRQQHLAHLSENASTTFFNVLGYLRDNLFQHALVVPGAPPVAELSFSEGVQRVESEEVQLLKEIIATMSKEGQANALMPEGIQYIMVRCVAEYVIGTRATSPLPDFFLDGKEGVARLRSDHKFQERYKAIQQDATLKAEFERILFHTDPEPFDQHIFADGPIKEVINALKGAAAPLNQGNPLSGAYLGEALKRCD